MQLTAELKSKIQQDLQKDDRFMRNDIQTTKLRQIASTRRMSGKRSIADLQKVGFAHSNGSEALKQFDPLRLKILIMPPQDANPVGKNADYFFLKGFKASSSEEYANAMSYYLKGLQIRDDHLLCRFNLGVILFKLGLFDEAISQYHTLQKQGYGNRPVVLFNTALCEL
jgi:tetratricopeptide (TPR) repeat protein